MQKNKNNGELTKAKKIPLVKLEIENNLQICRKENFCKKDSYLRIKFFTQRWGKFLSNAIYDAYMAARRGQSMDKTSRNLRLWKCQCREDC